MAKYILSDIFKGDFSISQFYGQRPEYYSQFGLSGHEGTDWATPTGTSILVPFDGQIVKDFDDPVGKAYGNNITIWDPIQKCALGYGHLKDNNVSLNDNVKKGQVLGHTNNTGKSSGPHLHLNFFETDANGIRLNTKNGYNGGLNVLDPNLVEWKLGNNQPIPQPANQSLPIVLTDQTKIPQLDNQEIQTIRSIINDQKAALTSKDQRIEDLSKANEQQIAITEDLRKQLKDCQNKPVETSKSHVTPQPSLSTLLGEFFSRLWQQKK